MIFFTLLLHILCARGLGIVSWIIVFIPFILMTVITAILMIVFGLDPSSGDYTVDVNETDKEKDEDEDEDEDEVEKDEEIITDKKVTTTTQDKKEREIIIVNPNSSKAYKIEGLENSESNQPPEMNTTSPNVFIRNIRKRI